MFDAILAAVARSLEAASLPYMVIGGQALLVHGEPRLTKDIDITLGVDIDSLELVKEAALSAGLKILPEDDQAFVRDTHVLPTIEPSTGIRVDLIFSFTPYERQAIGRAVSVHIGGEDVMFASAEDVIIHKLFAGRPRDLEDVRSILIKKPEVDAGYIVRWLAQFDQAVPGGRFVQTFQQLHAACDKPRS